MIKLTIDGNEIALSDDFSFDYFRENPLFGKSGDYTFDIDINLNNKQNSKIYSGIKRIGNHFSVKNRRAVLSDGIRTILDGTEVILSLENSLVQIQIVGGYSELNYLAGSNSKVRDLDLGTMRVPSMVSVPYYAKFMKDKLYGTNNFVYPPISISGEIYNHVFLSYDNLKYDTASKFRPMPFLLYYVDAVIGALGYNMSYNQLATVDKWRRLIVCHGYNTSDYAKLLPDWTVQEFIDEIERFFNAIYVVDSSTKKVQFISVKDYYDGKSAVIIEQSDIIGSFTRQYDVDDSKQDLYITYQNVCYSFPKNKGWEVADVDDEIMSKVDIISSSYETQTAVTEDWDNLVVYRDVAKNNLFFKPYMKYTQDGESSSKSYYKRRINDYAKFVSDENGNTITLKIIPSHIIQGITSATDENNTTVVVGSYLIPAVDNHEYLDEQLGFYELVNNESVQQETETSLNVAFYNGSANCRTNGDNYVYHYSMPMCWCSEWTAGSINAVKFRNEELSDVDKMTLELNGPNGRGLNDFYSDFGISHEQCYVIKFRTKEILDPMSLFVVGGVRFVCKKLTYQLDQSTSRYFVEGEFYRMI